MNLPADPSPLLILPAMSVNCAESLLSCCINSLPEVVRASTVPPSLPGASMSPFFTGWPRDVPGVTLMTLSWPRMLGELSRAVELSRMRSVAGLPSISLSIEKVDSTCGAFGSSEGGRSLTSSTFPMRTPARRTSEPRRSPSAFWKRAFRCSFVENGEMSPDAFSMRKMSTAMATTTSRPTLTSRIPTPFFAGGITHEGMRAERAACSKQKSKVTPS